MSHFVPRLSNHDLESLRVLVRAHLYEMGVHSAVGKNSGALKKRSGKVPGTPSSSLRTPGKNPAGPLIQRVFRRPLRDLSMVMVSFGDVVDVDISFEGEFLVPKFLVSLCDFLKDDKHVGSEGIFRKAGSTARQKTLRLSMETSENWTHTLNDASVYDVASLLKQFLRELPEPLIPVPIQKLLIESWQLKNEDRRLESILLCCCLLPPNHSSTLIYLVRFFHEISSHSKDNLMDLNNLAIVLTPTFFPMEENHSGSNENIGMKTEIVEALFRNCEKVGFLTESVSEAFNNFMSMSSNTISQSEDNLDDDNFTGPSERRRKKKKRRSGSISRVFTATMKGLQKAISRSATPVAPRYATNGGSSQFFFDNEAFASFHNTPLPKTQPGFTSPRLPAKRKARVEHELSPNSKQFKKLTIDSSFTPKVRGRSFSVKKFKSQRSKSLKGGLEVPSSAILSNYSPLPSKPSLRQGMTTPQTPVTDLPNQGMDIASPTFSTTDHSLVSAAGRHEDSVDSITRESESSMLCVPLEESPPRRTTKYEVRRRSRSPSERKIGMVRRRSQEAARRASKANLASSSSSSLASLRSNNTEPEEKPNLTNLEQVNMKSRLKKAPSPPKKAATPLRAKKQPAPTKATASSNSNSSLINLKQDIGTFIEKSFGSQENQLGETDDGFDNNLGGVLDQIGSVNLGGNSMRRQSSAFEFSRVQTSELFPPVASRELRRQSSAFEIAAKNRQLYQVGENLSRGATRVSLRRKNSSVKDLIKKLESNKKLSASSSSPTTPTTKSASTSSIETAEEAATGEEEVWTDAAEFFNKPTFNMAKRFVDEEPGCKRSSIIKIRNEKKGLVSKSVETFTRPNMPPPSSMLSRNHQFSATPSRRLSARMGVSTRTTLTPMKGPPLPSTTITPNNKRRQTLTGIRTSAKYKHSTEKPPLSSGKKTIVRIYQNDAENNLRSPALVSKLSTPDNKKKKVNRLNNDGRRYLTIGYMGEVRSPLSERQNIVPTVQRSKSAQTPLQRKIAVKTNRNSETENEQHPMVRRSHSTRSPVVAIPSENGEFEITTPRKTHQVRRHYSERASSSGKKPHSHEGGTPRSLLTKTNLSSNSPARHLKSGLKV